MRFYVNHYAKLYAQLAWCVNQFIAGYYSGLGLVSQHVCLSCVMLTRGQTVPARVSLVRFSLTVMTTTMTNFGGGDGI